MAVPRDRRCRSGSVRCGTGKAVSGPAPRSGSARRRPRLAGEIQVLRIKFIAAFNDIRVVKDAVYRTNLDALRNIIVADTFGAQL